MVTYVAFCANDELIVTASTDRSIIRWTTASGERIGKPLIHRQSINGVSVSADGTVIMSSTRSDSLCRWDAISAELIWKSAPKERSWLSNIWTNNNCTKIATWANMFDTITWWRTEPGGLILESSTLRRSADVTACAFDLNHGVAAVGLANGGVAVCDIYE